MAFTNLNTQHPNFDQWVILREIAAPAKAAPAVYVRQDGRGVTFLACDYRRADGTIGIKTLSIDNADKDKYEWDRP